MNASRVLRRTAHLTERVDENPYARDALAWAAPFGLGPGQLRDTRVRAARASVE